MKTAEETEAYCKKWVHAYSTPQEYLDLIGRDKIEMISATETGFLMDPYRKWIKSEAQIKELMDRKEG